MAVVQFDLRQVPRRMGRKEWKYWWRWKRVTMREQEALDEGKRQLLRRDDLEPEVRMAIAEQLINPPLIGPPWN